MSELTGKFDESSIPRAIAKFAVPTILSQFVVLIYNLADTFFVGRTNIPSQVAALALSFPIFMSLTMVGNLFGIGANSYISRALGRGEREKASKASTFALYGAVATVMVLMVALYVFFEPVLNILGAKNPETFTATKQYLMWTVIYGGIPTVISLIMGHLIRSEGNTKQASIGMILGGLLNVVLDFVFVQLMGYGAMGAGVATCISNVVAMCYLLFVAIKTQGTVIRLSIKELSFDKGMMKDVIFVGIPAAAVIILGSAANIVLTNQMSPYGDVSIAAYGIVQKFGTIAIQITVGLTQGIMPLLGFYFGSKQIDKVKEVNKCSFIILAIYSVFCVLLIMIFGKYLVLLFISETETVAKAVTFSKIWTFCVPGMCFSNLYCSIFQAMGKWKQSLAISVVRQAFLLIPLIIIFERLIGETGIVCAQPVADLSTLMVGSLMYIWEARKLK